MKGFCLLLLLLCFLNEAALIVKMVPPNIYTFSVLVRIIAQCMLDMKWQKGLTFGLAVLLVAHICIYIGSLPS